MDPNTIPLGVSSSPALPHSWTYDVFLCFRGVDTRKNFTDHLYSNLIQKGIKTFRDDDELKRKGEDISLKLLKALEESRISIIIFSENFASSAWCLDELVHILQCKQSKQQKVVPVFYKVDPSDVRNQRGSFGEALYNRERRFKDNEEKVKRWRAALREAAALSGWFLSDEYESTFIHKIVEDISLQVFKDHTYLNVAKYPIGIDSRVRDINNLLGVGENQNDVRMVGIWGNGGIGKTTVAKAVYNSNAHKFEGSCFVANVGEISKVPGGLVQLQKTVLSETLKAMGKDLEVTNVYEGISMIKRRLRDKRVLLILDEVNQLDQLNTLAGGSDWFGCGSRIIITSRDKHLLMAHQVDPIYEVKGLDHGEALQLFSWNAFPKSSLSSDYEELANKVVHYAQGLPLALILLGSLLCGRHLDQWRTVLSVLDNKKKVSNNEILEDLKITYNALDEWKIVLGVLDSYKRVPSVKIEDLSRITYDTLEDPVIEELIQKPLVNIEETRVWMHDMIEEMGEAPPYCQMATSTAWIFLLTNIGLEISSGIFDQFSSPSNPHSALISMLLAIVAVIISIWELIHKGIKEKVKYRRRLGIFGWFYSRSGDNRIFGSVPDICALLGGISQWVYSTVQYVCTLRHVENPYKIYLWPIIFLLCLGASRLHWNHRNMTTKLKQ
ncbi:hypothetical protein M0R45_007849 [Rubus argutus]|uniref:TIR domain-containing protein n=1 Tax=Rubus argutus TaxID=59490 RepID=A0AAW1Y0A7_RUBAR